MPDLLTTKEVARYLRLNEKKVYQLVAQNRLPATRISGKWLFPRQLIDQWIERHTSHPRSGLMGALLDEMVVIQGSDDWLLTKMLEGVREQLSTTVVTAKIGSLAGLSAIASGSAHMAGVHVDNEQVTELAGQRDGCYLINLFNRHQGLIYDADRHPGLQQVADVAERRLRFAERQPLSGTHRLARLLFAKQGVDIGTLSKAGPFCSHLEVALAIRTGRADAGLGIQIVAGLCGLSLIPLASEPFKLALPTQLASHPQISRLLDFILNGLGQDELRHVTGYGFEHLGKLETVRQP